MSLPSVRQSAAVISDIWIRNPGKRFSSVSSPHRMMEDDSAIVILMLVDMASGFIVFLKTE